MSECSNHAKSILASWTFSSLLTTRRSLYVKANSNTKAPRCENCSVPKALGLLTGKGASSVILRTTATLQQARTGVFVCARCVFTWYWAPLVYSAWRSSSSLGALSCFPQLCTRAYESVFSHCHLLWFLKLDRVKTSQPLAHSGPKRGATFELQLQQQNILIVGQRQLSVITHGGKQDAISRLRMSSKSLHSKQELCDVTNGINRSS